MNMFISGCIKGDKWGFELTSTTSENEFLLSEIKDEIYNLVSNGNYHSYYTEPQKICGKEFILRLYFDSGHITSISLSPILDVKPSWDNADTISLSQVKAANDKWLLDNFSVVTPSRFKWGVIESAMDKKTGSSSIVIRYN